MKRGEGEEGGKRGQGESPGGRGRGAYKIVMDIRASAEEHTRCQRSMDGRPVHIKHRCVMPLPYHGGFVGNFGSRTRPGSGTQMRIEMRVMRRAIGHGTHIAGMIYARELMESNNTIISRREKFRQVSCTWHRFLKFASKCQGDPTLGTKRKRP